MMLHIMKEHEIAHLASLARIKLESDEVAELQNDIAAIIGYVGTIASLTADVKSTKHVGARYNVFRDDVVTNEPGAYTERLLKAAPETEKGYVVVKKILDTTDS